MIELIVKNIKKIKNDLELLEKRLGVKISIKEPNQITIEGDSLKEYEAQIVLDAISFGYPVRTALLLKDEGMVFQKVNIKDVTRRKDLETIKARVIGTQGRTKRTIENIADANLIITGNDVGVICSTDEVDYVITALKNLIRGSKQSNVYNFLEKINTQKKEIDNE